MRQSKWAPSIVPGGEDQTVYLVLDDFGHLGQSWRETDIKDADLEAVITDLLEGQYNNPVRVVGFNTAEGWARDVSEDVADEIRRRCDLRMTDVPANLQSFVERHENRDRRQWLFDWSDGFRTAVCKCAPTDISFRLKATSRRLTYEPTHPSMGAKAWPCPGRAFCWIRKLRFGRLLSRHVA